MVRPEEIDSSGIIVIGQLQVLAFPTDLIRYSQRANVQ